MKKSIIALLLLFFTLYGDVYSQKYDVSPNANSPYQIRNKKKRKVIERIYFGIGYSYYKIKNSSFSTGSYAESINPGGQASSGIHFTIGHQSWKKYSLAVDFYYQPLERKIGQETRDGLQYSYPVRWDVVRYLFCVDYGIFSRSLSSVFIGCGFGYAATKYEQKNIISASGDYDIEHTAYKENSSNFVFQGRLRYEQKLPLYRLSILCEVSYTFHEAQMFKRFSDREFFSLSGFGFSASFCYSLPLRHEEKKKIRD